MNKEHKNNLAKRAYHRLVARALKSSPAILDEARTLVRAQQGEPVRARFVDEWAELLSRPASEISREITRRSERATRLRIDSPFYLIPTRIVTDEQRLALRRLASRLLSAPQPTWNARSAPVLTRSAAFVRALGS